MVEFGKLLLDSRKVEWKDYYINYDRLKKILKHQTGKPTKKKEELTTTPTTTTTTTTIVTKTATTSAAVTTSERELARLFRQALDQEIEKVVLFLLEQQGLLATRIQTLGQEREQMAQHVLNQLYAESSRDKQNDTEANEYDDHRQLDVTSDTHLPLKEHLRQLTLKYRHVGEAILEYVAFVELNVTGVRKILKKHDKNVAKPLKLSRRYLATFSADETESHLHQLYHYGGLSALVASLQMAFEHLHQLEGQVDNRLQQGQQTRTSLLVVSPSDNANAGDDPDRMVSTEGSMRYSWRSLEATTTEQSLLYSSQDELPQQEPFAVPATIHTFRREPILDKIQLARRRLQQSTKYVEVIAAQAIMFEDQMSEEEDLMMEFEQEIGARSNRQVISSLLNLASTFLYMTNYYIIAPTSGQYAMRLGSTPALAGIIIGMTPNAALVATVLYAWWSNYSYKSAILFAAMCSLMGNVCYAMALSHRSLALVMLGRFLNGFGSARSINRRFIADNFSKRQRTAASADFVTAGALGMAAGPAIAAVLGRLLPTSSASVRGPSDNLYWTVETAPGWIMLGLWSIFLICTYLFFEEPDRSNLIRQKTTLGQDLAVSNGSMGETRPLLPKEPSETFTHPIISVASLSNNKDQKLSTQRMLSFSTMFRKAAVPMTLWIYFILKLVLECLCSSSASLTTYYFHWNSQHSGSFLAFLGLLMFPANMVVAKLSHQYEDRELMLTTLLIMLVSVVGFLAFTPTYSVWQYMIFGICIFLTTNVLEGPNMSLLSKTIPKSWAKGTFNSGFLATEAGTAARSVGDLLISAAAGWLGFENLLNCTFIPLLFLISITILLFRRYYDHMVDDDDDDDESTTLGSKRGAKSASRQGSSIGEDKSV